MTDINTLRQDLKAKLLVPKTFEEHMKDISTLRQDLKAKLEEAEAIRKEIMVEDSRIGEQRAAERKAKVQEEFGSVIAEINGKIKAAAGLMSEANQLGQKAWKGSLKNNRYHEAGFENIDLYTIEDLIDLQPLTDQLYEAGIENITY